MRAALKQPLARWAKALPIRSALPSPRKSSARTWGKKIIDHHTYVMAGDGCLMEGISQEAIALAGMQKLSHLIVFWDNNNITIDGTVDIADITNQPMRFEASGWHVQSIDGHDPEAIDAAITAAKKDPRPSMIACKTHIALGHAAQDTVQGPRRSDQRRSVESRERSLWRAHG